MGTSNYPQFLDTSLELPHVDKNVTEVSGDAINALRDAVIAIQSTLGVNPQGSAANLVTRINGALDASGNIKASALSSAGLISLPISNTQIGDNAGIEESKLDLNFSTGRVLE